MLRRRTCTTCHVSTQMHANKKSTWRRRWKTSQSPLYSHLKTQHVVTCCERLHTSANIAEQETTLLGPIMLRVVASVCTGLLEGNVPRSRLKIFVQTSLIISFKPTSSSRQPDTYALGSTFFLTLCNALKYVFLVT